jgi:hypothetical protein
MSNQKIFTRREIYEAAWQNPLSKLAELWQTKPADIINACEKMNIPRPEPGHWTLVKRGWEIERAPLPRPDRKTVMEFTPPEPARKTESKSAAAEELEKTSRTVHIPKSLENAHPFVRQTRRALET